ncbi:c-type cytochrome [Phytohalomonas tamaricis]|uniref:c-type cytochrome n=1 Tax=Phytohalomonas tamaricis TaxID=2081032 RepID=UPI000D0B6676|nr:c-type cytochrome [Phytohalomonas tamaricis]
MAIKAWHSTGAATLGLVAGLLAASPAMAEVNGEAVYSDSCAKCHSDGGAPQRGDEDAWRGRLDKGMPMLYTHAIEGYEDMPAKGGNPALSDAEVKAAVDYLVAPVTDS